METILNLYYSYFGDKSTTSETIKFDKIKTTTAKELEISEDRIEGLDICFLMDATSSMSSWIVKTKENILKIMNDMQKEFPKSNIRLGIVAYRDYSDDPEIELFNLSNNHDEFKKFVSSLKAIGGDDQAEDIFSGIDQSLKMKWESKARSIIHFADAPCHNSKYHDSDVGDSYPNCGHKYNLEAKNLFSRMIELNIDYSFMKINNSTNKMISEFQELYDCEEKNRKIEIQEPEMSEEEVIVEKKNFMMKEKQRI